MAKVFLDADVLLDLFLEREPHHSVALRLLTELKRNGVGSYTSPVVLANVNYVLAKARDREYAIGKLRTLRRMIGIASIDEAMVDAALSAPYKDFEDTLQLQCAIGNRVETLVTRNVKDYPKGRMLITDPTQYLSTKALEKTR